VGRVRRTPNEAQNDAVELLDSRNESGMSIASVVRWRLGWRDGRCIELPTRPHRAPGQEPSVIEGVSRGCKQAGSRDAMRRFHVGEIPTYLDPSTGPREIDRVFTDRETYKRLVGCHVLDDVAITELRDHAPLVVDIAI
jgi:hypothetical protein